MKKLLLAMLMMPLMFSVSGCKASILDDRVITPASETEKDTEKEQRLFNDYEYVYVYSQMFGEKYYHVSTLKEYFFAEGIGLELELFTSKKHIYYFEQNLRYVLFTDYDSNLGRVIE